jgi:hypothetical protein
MVERGGYIEQPIDPRTGESITVDESEHFFGVSSAAQGSIAAT